MRRTTTGSKEVLRAHLMLHVHTELVRNILPYSLMSSIEHGSLTAHLALKKGLDMAVAQKPSSLLGSLSSETEHKLFKKELSVSEGEDVVHKVGEKSTGATVSGIDCPSEGSKKKNITPELSENEFARLLVLVRDDEEKKRHIYGLSTTLTRAQQDAGSRHGDLWNRIATRFNDKDFAPIEEFPHPVSNVTPSLPPLAERSGDKLSTVWRENKTCWTRTVANYEVSGNNREFPFIYFCNKNPRTKSLSAVGSRTFLTYCVFRLDYEDVDQIVGQFLTRDLPVNAGGSLGVNRDLSFIKGKRRRTSSNGEQSIGSKRTKSARSSSDMMFQEALTGLNSSMDKFAGSYQEKVQLQKDEFEERKKNKAEIHSSLQGSSAAEPLQTSVQRTTSLLEVIRSLNEAHDKYLDAVNRSLDPAYVAHQNTLMKASWRSRPRCRVR